MNNLVSQPRMKHSIQEMAVLAAVKRTPYIDIDVLLMTSFDNWGDTRGHSCSSLQKESNFRY